MKSVFDLKHNIARITPENLDDLWLLEKIITIGCLITAKTLRSVEIRREEEKIKIAMRLVLIKIFVEKVEFHEHAAQLRVKGKIVEAPEEIERGYHTIEVKPFTAIKIEKQWKKWEIDKIKAAKQKQEKVLICIMDEAEADLFLVQERAKHLAHFSCSLGKKTGVSTKPQYFADILSVMKKYEDLKYFFVAGPAFAKEDLLKYLEEKDRIVAKKIIINTVSQTGELGLQELLKRRVLEKATKLSRISEETATVEQLLQEIAKEGLAVYGRKESAVAAEAGAIELLLVSDKKVREFEEIMEKAEKTAAKIMIISSEHQAGEKLLGLGGIAGLLRYKTNYE